jgi:hypothetical protein
MMQPIPSILKNHSSSNNNVLYTAVFVNQDARGFSSGETGGVGYYTPTFFGIHNPTTSGVEVKVWTPSQGTAGTAGAQLYVQPGATVYSKIAKVEVGTGVTLTLFGAPTNAMLMQA